MKINKILILVATLVLMLQTVNALVLTNPVPTSGSSILGDGTEIFSIDTDVPSLVGKLWINNGGIWQSYNMNCASGTNCNVMPPLASYPDLTTYQFYFAVDSLNSPPFPSTYTFTIDRLPTTPTGLTCTGLTETTLRLDWADSADADFLNYDLDRDGSIVYTGVSSTYDNSGLTLGTDYTFRVRTRDLAGQTSAWSTTVTCHPEDKTPPSEPVITLPSPATYTTLTPAVNVLYGEPVNLKIYSGSVLIQNMGVCTSCNWNPIFTSDGMYSFNFRATDAALNERVTNYAMTIDATTTTASVEIASTTHILGADAPIVVKGTALSTTPNDYWVIRWDLSMFGGATNSVRATLQDLVSASQNIDIPTQAAPFIFCGEDYDAVNMDYDGTGPTYNVVNTWDETSPALSCVDTDPSGEVSYSVYMKIPVPGGLNSDDFNLNWLFGLY